MSNAGLVLIELNAGRIGGHWPDRLVRLTASAAGRQMSVTVVALLGVAPSTRQSLRAAGAMILEAPERADIVSNALLLTGKALGYLSDFAGWLLPGRALKKQFTLISWCLIEAASLRVSAYRKQPVETTTVILTASEALHGLVKRLANVAHIRVVHELMAREGAVLRFLGRTARSSEQDVVVVCLTDAVNRDHTERFPHVRTLVQRLALYAESDYLAEYERQAARADHGINDDEVVIALVGGWWPYKDMATVALAASLVRRRLRVIVAGTPIDDAILAFLSTSPNVQVTSLVSEIESGDHRKVYAASDFTIVSRHHGVTKGSGLVTDAVRMGVPLVLSDHDPALNELLTGRDWVRLFRTGDAVHLARTVDDIADHSLGRPSRGEAARLGMMTSEEALQFLIHANPSIQADLIDGHPALALDSGV